MSEPVSDTQWVPLAEVARPHGVRGELRLRLYNPDSDVLLEQQSVRLTLPGGEARELEVESSRRANDAMLMCFSAIADRDEAESLRGAIVAIPRQAFAPLGDGEFYVVDVLGKPALEEREGAAPVVIGTIKNVLHYPSVEVFEIALEQGGVLEVPSVDPYLLEASPQQVRFANLDALRELAAMGQAAPKPVRPRPPSKARSKRTKA